MKALRVFLWAHELGLSKLSRRLQRYVKCRPEIRAQGAALNTVLKGFNTLPSCMAYLGVTLAHWPPLGRLLLVEGASQHIRVIVRKLQVWTGQNPQPYRLSKVSLSVIFETGSLDLMNHVLINNNQTS